MKVMKIFPLQYLKMFGSDIQQEKKLGFSKISTQKFMKMNHQEQQESQAVEKVQYLRYYLDFMKLTKDKFYIKEKI